MRGSQRYKGKEESRKEESNNYYDSWRSHDGDGVVSYRVVSYVTEQLFSSAAASCTSWVAFEFQRVRKTIFAVVIAEYGSASWNEGMKVARYFSPWVRCVGAWDVSVG